MTAPAMTRAPPFTPAELVDAGRRAEAEGRADLAIRFYRALTEHFAEAPEAAEAHNALGRIGVDASGGASQATAYRGLRHQPAARRDRYADGRVLAHVFGILGWLLALGGVAGFPACLLLCTGPLTPAELLPVAGGATGSLLLGCGVALAAQVARAQFDQASAARDLVAIERARLGLD